MAKKWILFWKLKTMQVIENISEMPIRRINLVTFLKSDKVLGFPYDVIFPHEFLDDILRNLYSEKNMIVRNVYEGTIPDTFQYLVFTDQETKINKTFPKGLSINLKDSDGLLQDKGRFQSLNKLFI